MKISPLRLFHEPPALELAAAELETAKRDLLRAAASREYFSALEDMLHLRITRLQAAVYDLSQPEQQP